MVACSFFHSSRQCSALSAKANLYRIIGKDMFPAGTSRFKGAKLTGLAILLDSYIHCTGPIRILISTLQDQNKDSYIHCTGPIRILISTLN